MIGKLYLIPSPIGNLKEVSPRMIETISSCDLIACEDTRNTAKLLSLIAVSKPCFSCHEHNEKQASQTLISKILGGKTVGFLSDAGYPCISDPGLILVKEAIKNNIEIVPISGPNAFLNALIGSGLDTSHFFFYGFLDSRPSQRKKELENIKNITSTILFYESPHRINETLKDMYDILGDRKVVVARELTKLHEEFIRTSLKEITSSTPNLIGEMVIVLEGKEETKEDISNETILNTYKKFIDAKFTTKDAILATSIALNIKKNLVYSLVNKEK